MFRIQRLDSSGTILEGTIKVYDSDPFFTVWDQNHIDTGLRDMLLRLATSNSLTSLQRGYN
jgi:hypothetical protein